MAEWNDADGQDRTESPSQYRREEFRRKGSVASSRELTGIVLLMGVGLAISTAGSGWTEAFRKLCETFFQFDRVPELSHKLIVEQEAQAFRTLLQIVGPIFLAACLTGLAVGASQVGLYWTWEPIVPNFDRINPASGIKRILSLQSVFDSAKSIFKMGIVGLVLYLSISKAILHAPLLFERATPEIASEIGNSLLSLFQKICASLLVIAGADYAWSRYRLEKQMKMTKKEAKDEMKLREGDPAMKARIRNMQRKIVSKRMMAEVPKADVIITNPTHFAVALKYDAESMAAPKVVAKGMDFLALRIRELAKRSNVPIVENKPLARKLYKEIPVGRPIHRDLYKAVAQVLAYVYRLKNPSQSASA